MSIVFPILGLILLVIIGLLAYGNRAKFLKRF
jgi:hypothetical protein